ncbi:MAG: phage major capsid protein, partial [Sarcina sp.]
MTKLELIDKKEQLEARLKELITDAESEHRKLSETEDNEYNKLKDELLETRNLLNQFTDKPLTINTNKTNTMETRQFSILKAINEKLNGQFTDETRAVIEAGKSAMSNAGQSFKGDILIPMEERAITITGGDATGGVVKTIEKTSILEPLRNSLVMVNAGATYLSNLKGDVAIPSYSGSNVGWASEVDSATDGKGTFKEVVLKPKRLTAILDVSKQFLI